MSRTVWKSDKEDSPSVRKAKKNKKEEITIYSLVRKLDKEGMAILEGFKTTSKEKVGGCGDTMMKNKLCKDWSNKLVYWTRMYEYCVHTKYPPPPKKKKFVGQMRR